jgi:UDPglucose--hexose-1-phosphate uridylyltransferase
MERAPIEEKISFKGFDNVEAGLVKWPMSVIRLRSDDKNALVELADKILLAWRGYSDESAFVFAETDGEPHNTITPIARTAGGKLELDLVLRNNITTEEHPLGVFHPHEKLHNIKKENIGLIEVMGLAVLPSRLKNEIVLLCDAILCGKNIADIPDIEKHAAWFDSFKENYEFTADNVEGIIRTEIGKTFVNVLRDAGVYRDDVAGRAAFMKFIDSIG